MPDLPTVTGGEAIKAFEAAGFVFDRKRGSHVILKRPGHRFNLCIPVHGSATLKPGLLRAQIRNAGMTIEEFIANLG